MYISKSLEFYTVIIYRTWGFKMECIVVSPQLRLQCCDIQATAESKDREEKIIVVHQGQHC